MLNLECCSLLLTRQKYYSDYAILQQTYKNNFWGGDTYLVYEFFYFGKLIYF